jgi:predicted unusual protein kinase regulating ubiquinone biosynthesis (AarF/ABC1/UbiB family)
MRHAGHEGSFTASLSATLKRAASVATRSVKLVANVVDDVDRLVTNVTRNAGAVAGESQALAREATRTAERLGVSVRAAPRVARVVSEAALLIGRYRLGEATPELHEDAAHRVHDLAAELRGGVLKLGQLASCRVDLLPPEWIAWLSRLQDRVPPIDAAAVRARIEDELGLPVEELFAGFDDEPLACASIAQVHAATLPDGREVVVKVQLPGVEDIIEADLVALRLVAAMLGDLLPKTDLPTIIAELSRSVRGELDFVAEVDALEAARAAFTGDARVRVPQPVRALCSRRVIVMERLAGRPLLAFLEDAATTPAARDRLLQTLVGAYATQILVHGRFQADAHPGNFLADGDAPGGPVLGLLDFGCVQILSPAARRGYATIVGAVLTRDRDRLVEGLVSMGFATADGDTRTLEHFAELMLGSLRADVDLSTIDPRAMFDQALAALRENPVVRVPQEFVMIGRVFASLGGLILRYQPKVDLLAAVGPAIAASMAQPRATAAPATAPSASR